MNAHRYSLLPVIGIYASALIALAGCKAEEPTEVKRLPGERPPLHQSVTSLESADADSATTEGVVMPISAATDLMVGGNILQVAGLAFTTGDDWKNVDPTSSMRAAQYEIPGPGGPAEAVVFYFGPNQGGSLEDNVRRWAGQFTADDNTTQTAAEVARVEKEDLRLALVKTSGTYNPGMMGVPGVDSTPKPGYALFGLVVEGGPQGTVFVRVTGPQETVESQSTNLEKFAQSVRVSRFQ